MFERGQEALNGDRAMGADVLLDLDRHAGHRRADRLGLLHGAGHHAAEGGEAADGEARLLQEGAT